ncbi:hypothetical protein [Paenibacillus alvei]|uniref:Uncharacterized protein n=1 Tax=Paenibacillus alvei TaxID=44250 RepID=A0ABT4H235_PAEAL|nr:hypothetical protein [Paenibacillus alvei]MCY9762711.1 hypothetical protein [Paenibacillus alvei]
MEQHRIECAVKVPETLVQAISAVKLGERSGNITVSTPRGIEFVATYSPDRAKMVEALKFVRNLGITAGDEKNDIQKRKEINQHEPITSVPVCR